MIFTLRLAQIRIGEEEGCDVLFDLFLQSTTMVEPTRISTSLCGGKLTKSQLAQLEDVANGPHLQGLIESMESSEERWL